MTSAIPLDDVKAAQVHLQEAAAKMTGKDKKEAQRILTDLTALIGKRPEGSNPLSGAVHE